MASLRKTDGPHAFLFFSHLESWSLKRQFDRLKAATAVYGDLFWLMDCTEEAQPLSRERSTFRFTIDEVNELSPMFQLTSTVPGYGHLPTILFADRYSHYQYFWIIEYDVRFGGDWATFFDHFIDVDADLLATDMRSYSEDPEWELWELSSPTTSIPLEERHAGFHPFFRISRRALQFLFQAHQEGWEGHYEVLMPTLLRKNGYDVHDLNEFGQWYRPEQFRWRPPMWWSDWATNELYHPVKPLTWMLKDLLRRVRSRLPASTSNWNLRSFLPWG